MLFRKIFIAVLIYLLPGIMEAQILPWSTYLNSPGNDMFLDMVKDNAGDVYVLGKTDSNGFPITSGALQTGINKGAKYTLSKLSGSSGSLLWSTYLDGTDNTANYYFDFFRGYCKLYWDTVSNSICIWAYTNAGDYPVVNGNSYTQGTGSASIFTQLDATTGSILFSTYLFRKETMTSGDVSITAFDRIKFTNGSAYFMGVAFDSKALFVSAVDLSLHRFVFQKEININNGWFFTYGMGAAGYGFAVNNGNVYIAGITNATDYPVTQGSYQPVYPAGAAKSYFITRLDNAGNIVFSTFADPCSGGGREDYVLHDLLDVANGEVAFAASFAGGIAVSPGGIAFDIDTLQNTNRGFMKLDANTGSRKYFSYLGPDDPYTFMHTFRGIRYVGDNLLLYGITTNGYLPVTANAGQLFKTYPNYQYDFFIAQLNASNKLVYCSYLGGSGVDVLSLAAVDKTDVYFSGVTESKDFPLTTNAVQNIHKGVKFHSIGDLVIVKYNTSERRIKFSSFLGSDVHDQIVVNENYPYMYGAPKAIKNFTAENGIVTMAATSYILDTLKIDYPVTPDALYKKMQGNNYVSQALQYTARINTVTGKLIYGSYISGLPDSTFTQNVSLLSNGDDIYLAGRTQSKTYPVTAGAVRTSYLGNGDVFVTKLSLCYPQIENSTLAPANQFLCPFNLVDTIAGSEPQLENTPVLLRNAAAESQAGLTNFTYQWQQSTDNISWEMIAGAISKDYKPEPSAITKYYRRLARPVYCSTTDTSTVATVTIGNVQGASVNAGGVNGNLYGCAGSPVTLGTAAVQGVVYRWSPSRYLSDTTIAQPICNAPGGNFTYVLKATTAGGCTTADTITVYNYKANAGRDITMCPSAQTQIGEWPLPGISGVVYNWQPAAGLSCTNCARPVVSAGGTYILNVSVPLTAGGTCISKDTVTVIPDVLPKNPAGADKTICDMSSVILGTPRVPGYIYNWSPSAYLSAESDTAQPVFNSNYYPVQLIHNPVSYILTATNTSTGCKVVDTTTVQVMILSAGNDGCRPLQLGKPGMSHGQQNATYQWVRVLDNNMEVPVEPDELSSAIIQNPVALYNTGIKTDRTYRLKMTLNGATCTDDVIVWVNCFPGGSGGGGSVCPKPALKFSSKNGCPRVEGNDSVSLFVLNPTPDFIYTWSPATGLSSTTGTNVKTGITSNITYICTATYIYDASISCLDSIKVNRSKIPAPVFDAKDTTLCRGVVANIGVPAVNNIVYRWLPDPYYAAPVFNEANPQLTASINVNYYASAADTITGCITNDTVRITVENVVAYAGPNRSSCENGGFKIGNPAVAGFTYQWQPAAGLDNAGIAQPTVIANSSNVIYLLTVTEPVSGCWDTSAVLIIHSGRPEIPNLSVPQPVCVNSSGVYIGTFPMEGVSYNWLPSTGLSNPAASLTIANPAVTTTYTLQATAAGCSQAATQQVTVTILPQPSVSITAVNNCNTSQLNVSTNAAAAYYDWQPYTGLTSYYIPNPVATVNAPAIYTVRVFDRSTYCSDTASVIVIPPVTADAGKDVAICSGAPLQLGAPAVAGVQYNWSPAEGLSNVAVAQPSFTNKQPGAYYYTLNSTGTNCSKTDDIAITVMPVPALSLTQHIAVCSNASLQIGTTPQNGFVYSWLPVEGLSDPVAANPFVSVNTTTGYTLTATNMLTGCTSSAGTIVTVNNANAPIVTVSGTGPVCAGVQVQLKASATGNYVYLWEPDVNFVTSRFTSNPIIRPVASTVYTVTVSNSSNGCSSILPFEVVVTDTCNVVPVTWIDFDAVLQGSKTILTWVVSMEQNNKGFTVQRSNDGIHWEELIYIKSLGNTYNQREYHTVDEMPAEGINFYRIKQTDADGKITYSIVKNVRLTDVTSYFHIYPNPADNVLFYELKNGSSTRNVDMCLYDIDGRLLKRFHALKSKGSIPLNSVPAGMYILAITDNSGIIHRKKVLLQK
ncbi:MAG: T9SS type A sorting domain-containing protein [Ferruginibacter sp.]